GHEQSPEQTIPSGECGRSGRHAGHSGSARFTLSWSRETMCGRAVFSEGCWWDSGGLRPWSERADDKRRPIRPESAHWHSPKKPPRVPRSRNGASVGLSRPLRFDLVLTTAREEGVRQRRLALASLHLMKSLAEGRAVAHMNPPAAVPQITGADTQSEFCGRPL